MLTFGIALASMGRSAAPSTHCHWKLLFSGAGKPELLTVGRNLHGCTKRLGEVQVGGVDRLRTLITCSHWQPAGCVTLGSAPHARSFNKTTVKTFVLDIVKGWAIGAVLGLPIIAALLKIVEWAGPSFVKWTMLAMCVPRPSKR